MGLPAGDATGQIMAIKPFKWSGWGFCTLRVKRSIINRCGGVLNWASVMAQAITSIHKIHKAPSLRSDKMFQHIQDNIKELLGIKVLSDADLTAELEKKAEGRDLNWKSSVVDFLTLLGMDSSRKNRDALAAELGVSKELKSGSAAKNEALRVAVFKKLAENGGKIPGSLLD